MGTSCSYLVPDAVYQVSIISAIRFGRSFVQYMGMAAILDNIIESNVTIRTKNCQNTT